MGSREKGNRRERQARELLEKKGYLVETPNSTRFQREDFFGLFDIIAIEPEEKIRLIQVKSNVATDINEFQTEVCNKMPTEHTVCEYWVCHDSAGWRVIQIANSGRETVVDERSQNGNMGDGILEYLSS